MTGGAPQPLASGGTRTLLIDLQMKKKEMQNYYCNKYF
jgi:hypothetical protein